MYSLLFESETFSKINEVTSSINKISVMMKDGPTHFFFLLLNYGFMKLSYGMKNGFVPVMVTPYPRQFLNIKPHVI